MPKTTKASSSEAQTNETGDEAKLARISPDAQSLWRTMQMASITPNTMSELIANFAAKNPDNEAKPREGEPEEIVKTLPNKEVRLKLFANGRVEFGYSVV